MWAEYNKDVKELTTMGVGGQVGCYIAPMNHRDLVDILGLLRKRERRRS